MKESPLHFNKITDEFTPTKLVVSALQSVVISGIVLVLTLLMNTSPPGVFIWTAGAFAISALTLRITNNTVWSRWAFFALLGLGLAALILAAVQQRAADARYKIDFAGVSLARLGHTLPDGSGQVTGVNLIVLFDNKNPYPIYYRIDRRYGKVSAQSASLFNDRLPAGQIDRLDPNQELECGTDAINVTLLNGQWIPGEVECRILFGRSKDKLDRVISYSGKIEFFLCPGTGLQCGPVRTSDSELIVAKVMD